MRKIFFYEFLNFRPAGASAIAFETAKVAYIVGATENKRLVQEGPFSFLIYGYATLDVLAISHFRIIHSF